MRDRTAFALFFGALLVIAAGLYLPTVDVPPGTAPEATFSAEYDAATDDLVVEHLAGEPLASGDVAVLVYADRPVVPDRTVHRTTWTVDAESVRPGDRLEIEDPRFEPGHRLVVRWYGDPGQANLHVERL